MKKAANANDKIDKLIKSVKSSRSSVDRDNLKMQLKLEKQNRRRENQNGILEDILKSNLTEPQASHVQKKLDLMNIMRKSYEKINEHEFRKDVRDSESRTCDAKNSKII